MSGSPHRIVASGADYPPRGFDTVQFFSQLEAGSINRPRLTKTSASLLGQRSRNFVFPLLELPERTIHQLFLGALNCRSQDRSPIC